MQSFGSNVGGTTLQAGLIRSALIRFGFAAALALACGGGPSGEVGAKTQDTGPINTGASNGGIASASSGGNVSIGQIITGENTGNSIVTGNITGNAELHGGEIDYPTDVNVSQDIGPLMATADGGDYGEASAPSPKPPEYHIDIDNTDKNRNDNRSDATGIGEGGEGGQGGSGGTVIIDEPEPVS
jgi:hypothetical protein